MLKKIFDKLLKEYGPQGWWPVNGKYNKNNFDIPRNKKEEFEIMLGAILTQNTAWKNVEKALRNLREKELIYAEKIKKMPQKKLAELIRPSGYYHQKAERLKIVSDFFLENKNISKKPVDEMRSMLLDVKGIGPETADSIILYAFRKPSFVIDLYTKRIFSRLGICRKDCKYDELQDMFHSNLQSDAKLFNEYHALIVEHAKRFCAKKPNCRYCPLKRNCKQKF
jgi:endonuclease-3 related protein